MPIKMFAFFFVSALACSELFQSTPSIVHVPKISALTLLNALSV